MKLRDFPIFVVTLGSKIFLLSASQTLPNESDRYKPTIDDRNKSKSRSEDMGYLADYSKFFNFKCVTQYPFTSFLLIQEEF